MSGLFHVDQATADRWRADGRFVLFGEGDTCPGTRTSCPPMTRAMCRYDGKNHPPAWMVEAAKPCEMQPMPKWAGGQVMPSCHASGCCVEFVCSNGQRRHPITVPCLTYGDTHIGGNRDDAKRASGTGRCETEPPCRHGRISTGLLAVVEWGPWQIVESWIGSRTAPIPAACLSHDGFLDWRWSSDDLSLVGQFAIGGRIEVTP